MNYFYHQGQSSGQLAKFAEDPILCKRYVPSKQYFEEGKAFEDLFESIVTGSDLFESKYVVLNGDYSISDKFAEFFNSGKLLENYFKKIPREQSKTYETRQFLIHEAIKNPDCRIRYPVNKTDYENMLRSVHDVLEAEVEINGINFQVGDVLTECEFQKEIYWEKDGIKKKAKVDIVAFVDIPLHDRVVAFFDIKYMTNLANFDKSFKRPDCRYVIQSMHYTEGMQATYSGCIDQMIFLVATKSDPFLVRPSVIDDAVSYGDISDLDHCIDYYNQLSLDYDEWEKQGFPVSRVKDEKKHKIWRINGS